MDLKNFLQKRLSVLVVLGMSSIIGLSFSVGKGIVGYTSLYTSSDTQVLGAKDAKQTQCIPSETIEKFLGDTKKTVTLYAPNKSVTIPLEPLMSCFQSTGCDAAEFSCNDGKISLVESCVSAYFQKYPLEVEQTKLVSGAGAVAQVRVQDWTVNYANLAEQLSKAVSEEVKYCQVEGKADQSRQNIGNIQLVVADELPGMQGQVFTKRFIEVDESKRKLYFWNDGIYQTVSLSISGRLPKEGVYLKSSVDFSKLVGSVDAAFLTRNSQDSDFVVIHE